jgi:hypothetical protein
MNPASREFPANEPIDLFVRLGGGVVVVIAEERVTAAVDIYPYDSSEGSLHAADDTIVEQRGGRLRIEVPQSHGGWLLRRGPRVRADVRIPLDSSVQARVGSADVLCEGRLGSLTVTTGSGDIRVAEVGGDLSVDTGSGDLRVEHVAGVLRLNCASGHLLATRVCGEIVANSASGDVHIENSHGPVRATTASGDVHLGATHAGPVRIDSASGDVTVGVPAGTWVWLDLNTVSGSTSSELDMMPTSPERDGVLTLQVRTISGDISVQRVFTPAPA